MENKEEKKEFIQCSDCKSPSNLSKHGELILCNSCTAKRLSGEKAQRLEALKKAQVGEYVKEPLEEGDEVPTKFKNLNDYRTLALKSGIKKEEEEYDGEVEPIVISKPITPKKEERYIKRIEEDPILEKNNRIVVNSSNYLFFKILGCVFIFVLIFALISGTVIILKDGSLKSTTSLICGNVTVEPTVCPSLPLIPQCPTAPACNCPTTNCYANLTCGTIKICSNGTAC